MKCIVKKKAYKIKIAITKQEKATNNTIKTLHIAITIFTYKQPVTRNTYKKNPLSKRFSYYL